VLQRWLELARVWLPKARKARLYIGVSHVVPTQPSPSIVDAGPRRSSQPKHPGTRTSGPMWYPSKYKTGKGGKV
jgi:hypothetical protein